jgi:putative membrane protein
MRRPFQRLTLGALAVVGLFGTAALAADSDAEFVKSAASGGMLEVELGRYASQHAANPSVRAFGQRMVTDHGKANAELSAVAKRQGLSVPTEMNDEHQKLRARLTKLTGKDFDAAYMRAMVDDHQHDVAEFRMEANEAKSEVDRWAAKVLPTLESHLSEARKVNAQLASIAGMSSGETPIEPNAGAPSEQMPGPAATPQQP